MTGGKQLEEITTLPDYLAHGLDIVLVGLNPSEYSVRLGHYFANPRNRFWTAFNRSGLVDLELTPELDATLLEYGIGLTDLAKRPTRQGSGLKAADYRAGAPVLEEKLLTYRPRIVCFQGLMGYGRYLQYCKSAKERPELGRQPGTIGDSIVFVTPNPSPANAQFSLDDLVRCFRELKALRDGLAS